MVRPQIVKIEFMSKFILLLILASTSALSGGCRTLATSTPPETGTGPIKSLPKHKMRSGSVALEIAVVSIPESMQETCDSAWSSIDVQAIDLETRQLLDQNGLRVGVTGTRLPAELARLIQWSEPITGEAAAGGNHRSLASFDHSQQFGSHQVQQLQPGTEHWIPCAPLLPQLAWQVEKDGQVKSGLCSDANCGIAVGLVSAGDGNVRLWLRPEILHGEKKMRYGLGEGNFVFEQSQNRQPISDLGFTCRLIPGQTLILAATPAESLIGNSLLGSNPQDTSIRPRLLLIRPVNLQSDDLFETNGSTSRRLSTSLD